MRHSPAGFGSNDPRDEEWRGLTDGGRNISEAIGREMLQQGEVPKIILSSDHQRTCETARIVGTIMGVRIDDLDELKPSLPLAPLVADFLDNDDKKRLMIVAHSDNIQTYAELFCGDDEPFAKGEVRRYEIDRDSREGSLKWQLRPSDLGFVDEYETPLAGTPEAADMDIA
jgi:phosphohistidine phosphatase SixA